MSKIQEGIQESFYRELATVDGIDERMLSELRELFSSGKKVKADALVAVFARSSASDLK
jgi:hypothetical protein